MDYPGSLETIAEIAVALAGFSALVALLATKDQARRKFEALGLQVMLEASLFVVALSLLPVVLFELGLAAGTVWRSSAAIFLIVDIAITVSVRMRSRGWSEHFGSGERIVAPATSILSSIADGLMLWVLVDYGVGSPSGVYLLALYLNLLLAGILFVRFAATNLVPAE